MKLEESTVLDTGDDTYFVVKDAPTDKNPANNASQRTIEFDLNTLEDDFLPDISRVRRPIDTRKAGDRVTTIKRTHEELKELKQTMRQTDKDIDELENTPAFKRKQIPVEPKKYSDESRISNYSLTDDENSQVKLSKENPYLHGAVD
jgi:hypothetical protein